MYRGAFIEQGVFNRVRAPIISFKVPRNVVLNFRLEFAKMTLYLLSAFS